MSMEHYAVNDTKRQYAHLGKSMGGYDGWDPLIGGDLPTIRALLAQCSTALFSEEELDEYARVIHEMGVEATYDDQWYVPPKEYTEVVDYWGLWFIAYRRKNGPGPYPLGAS